MNDKLPRRVTWDGHVLSIGRKYFWARLQDRASDGAEDARIPIKELKARDRKLLRLGAWFTMTANTKRVVINFIRSRPWTKAELAAAKAAAEKMAIFLS